MIPVSRTSTLRVASGEEVGACSMGSPWAWSGDGEGGTTALVEGLTLAPFASSCAPAVSASTSALPPCFSLRP